MLIRDHTEWLEQAADDLKSAEVLLQGGRYTHCVFFCHLALEKSLKAAHCKKFKAEPPKTHNLALLMNETAMNPPADIMKLIDRLATASVPTRYPDDLRRMSDIYTKSTTPAILGESKKAFTWIKELLEK